MGRAVTASLALAAALFLAVPAAAGGDPEVAALQVGLRARGLYTGTVDGVVGASTEQAVRRLQRRAGLPVDGVPGPQTRLALGRYGRRAPLGGRPLELGRSGWDVAALQFALAWHGFPSGTFDGHFGGHTDAALRRFQRWQGISPEGLAGVATIAALRAPPPLCPVRLARPLPGPISDPFGPRGARFHAGVDFPARAGTAVGAAGWGVVVYAASGGGGWGKQVVVAHGAGVRTRYAHLSRIRVRVGQRVSAGSTIGLVGATGEATGPHLHFEVLVRGANVDPESALLTTRRGQTASSLTPQ